MSGETAQAIVTTSDSSQAGRSIIGAAGLPLDEDLYNLDDVESSFFKQQTGIQDDAELKAHLLAVQKEAYAIHPYSCIRRFSWAKLKISRLFPYPELLKLGKERDGAIFLDIGCCFGNDARKAIADGYPAQNVVASDLHQAFWDLGHKLFKTTPETDPLTFIAGDVFDPSNLETIPAFTLASPPTTATPQLSTLRSLNPLRGHVSAIHASAFFHLFQEDDQRRLAFALASLLSPEPGSMIFGQHASRPEKGQGDVTKARTSMFNHSPESWAELWDGDVFEKGTVRVETQLVQLSGEEVLKTWKSPSHAVYVLNYSVTRL
ncbi:hypothetical protein BV25DRAFT_1565307 [Artomyces pyxidatus]|uniref:Uncharacterized protein n=1 Tax=Artomyces pyxidatus TaxID=48021 RepID=A0ACB8SJF3_9AGAM|nr:hypothetical protein BV25DRAFT_1565307 [Artomyces pyxidatus]